MNVELLKEFLEKKIISLQKHITDYAEETGRDDSEVSFYDLGLDSEGMPYAHGNSDDVYSSGFDNGSLDGKDDAYHEVLSFIINNGAVS